MPMYLAGVPVRDQAILDLARLVDDPLLAASWKAPTAAAPRSWPSRSPNGKPSSPRSTTRRPTSPSSAASC